MNTELAARIVDIVEFMTKFDPGKTGKRFSVGDRPIDHRAADSLETTGLYRINRDFGSWTIRYK